MRTAKYFIFSIIVLLFTLLTACSSTTDPAESYRGETGQQIFQGGEDALRDRNYAEAIKRFEALDAQYPFDRNIETAQLHIIYAYYMNSDYVSAEAAADRFIHLHPTSQHDDYAYYMRGLSNYYQNMGVFERLFAVDFATRDLTQVKKSYNDFATLQRRYPASPYAPAAHQYMIYLRDVLANHQLQVAQYYFNRQAYVASANRASLVVEHYQGAPAVPDALVMMAKSYYQLHLGEQLNQTIEVLQYNYPNSPYTEEVNSRELGNTSFTSISQKEAMTPVKQSPAMAATPPNQVMASATPVGVPANPENVAYMQQDANNRVRGTTTPVGQLVQSFESWHAKQQKPVVAQQQQVPQQQPVQQQAQTQPVVQPQELQQQMQREESQQQVAASQQQSAQVAPAQTNNQSPPPGMTLGSLWDKVKNADFFSSHSKTAKADSSEQPQPTQADASLAGTPPAAVPAAEQQQAQQEPQQPQQAQQQQVAAADAAPYSAVAHDNGSRR